MGLFDCFSNVSSCLAVCFCQPCTVAQTTSIARGGDKNAFVAVVAVMILLFFLTSWSGEFAYLLMGGSFLAILYARMKIRKRKNLEGSCARDTVYSFFCGACSVCQILNHFGKYRGFWDSYHDVEKAQIADNVVDDFAAPQNTNVPPVTGLRVYP